MSLVLDASVTLARVLPEEMNDAIHQVFQQVSESGAWVPSLWKLEVANAIHQSTRRGRISASHREGILSDLAALEINVDSETLIHAWGATLRLADDHGLTVYDATYLELALRLNLPLATLDRKLRSAALAEAVLLLGI